MSLKGQKTKSDFVEWNAITSLVLKLERDGDYKFALVIACGIYTGLRISDILSLSWSDVLEKDQIDIVEKKTKKSRRITLNSELKQILNRCYQNLNSPDPTQLIFLNRFGKQVITVQYVNRRLKEIMEQYKVARNGSAVSSHSLRKSFGRRVFERNQNSERSLILLSEILNHSSIGTTKIYLGIREEEIGEVYENL